ncbi:MAG: hypothetical protein ABR509_05575 [Candidatus Limnocylindria bacterium]
MIELVLLVGFVATGAAALGIGWPAYRSSRARRDRLRHEERYLAWRGRARHAAGSPLDAYQAGEERRRLVIAVALAVISTGCLIGFLVSAV